MEHSNFVTIKGIGKRGFEKFWYLFSENDWRWEDPDHDSKGHLGPWKRFKKAREIAYLNKIYELQERIRKAEGIIKGVHDSNVCAEAYIEEYGPLETEEED